MSGLADGWIGPISSHYGKRGYFGSGQNFRSTWINNTHRNSFSNLIYKENTAALNCKLEKMEINYTFWGFFFLQDYIYKKSMLIVGFVLKQIIYNSI